MPLALRLAVRWVREGGEIAELPEQLPAALVDSFLYQRILDRVVDPALKPVARDALVLRRVTADIVAEVLADSAPEGMDPAEVFARLSRELALVGDESESGGASVVLPDRVSCACAGIRAATLRLLVLARRDRTRTIDQRAATWYAARDVDVPG